MMTKKDYFVIATVLSNEVTRIGHGREDLPYNIGARHSVHNVIADLAMALGDANPNFDKVKFIQAASVDMAKVKI